MLDDLSYSYTLGIAENEIQQVNLFPNPANGVVMVDNTSMRATGARLFSYDGKLAKTFVLSDNINTLDVSGLAAGFYFMRAEGKNGTKFRSKLVID